MKKQKNKYPAEIIEQLSAEYLRGDSFNDISRRHTIPKSTAAYLVKNHLAVKKIQRPKDERPTDFCLRYPNKK